MGAFDFYTSRAGNVELTASPFLDPQRPLDGLDPNLPLPADIRAIPLSAIGLPH